MSKLKKNCKSPKIMGKCSKLHFFSSKISIKFSIISFTKCVSNYLKLVNLLGKRHSVSEQLFKWLPKSPFSLATPQLHEDLDQTGNHIQTTPRNPSFWQGVICHVYVRWYRFGFKTCVYIFLLTSSARVLKFC